MVQLKKMVDHSQITCQVERIDKKKASEYLSKNFAQNRFLKPRTLAKIVDDIKNDRFFLGWDCLAFNEEGFLVNGQHRLNAVIQADKACDFLVVRNVRHSTIRHFDQGNKRTQADRISVNGTRMHSKACACIKASMRNFNDKHEGTTVYGYERYDDIIAYIYKKHSQFFDRLEQDGYFRCKYINSYIMAAFKIFSEMKVGTSKNINYSHNMGPYERATYWLDICIDGSSENREINYNTDQAIFSLKERLLTRKAKGFTMYGLSAHKLYVVAASYFMKGKNTTVRSENLQNDPFTDLRSLPSTNDYEPIIKKGFNE